jgi:hypothetical protein
MKLLKIESHFRCITIRLILHSVESYFAGGYNIETYKILNQVLLQYYNSIKQALTHSKSIKENGYEIFLDEWKNYQHKTLGLTLKSLISRPFLLIPFNLEDVVEEYPNLLKIQRNDLINFRDNFLIFFTLIDALYVNYNLDQILGRPISQFEINILFKL